MPVAIVQIKPSLASPQKNKEKMLFFISEARKYGAESIIFPEFSLSGLFYDELVYDDGLLNDCREAAGQIAAAATDIKVIFGNLEKENNSVFSRVYIAQNGNLQPINTVSTKGFMANCTGPYPADGEGTPIELTIDGQSRRVLILQGDWRGKKLPITVGDTDLLLCLSPRPLVIEEAQNYALDTEIPIIHLNSVGLFSSGKTNYLFAGHSAYYGAKGEILASAPYFEEGLYLWNWNGSIIHEPFNKSQLLAEALIEGVRQFCASIHIQRAVIGISGGIDSALAACVYRQALGGDNVFLISMPSRFNSEATRFLSKKMAATLGLGFRLLPIDDATEQLTHSLEKKNLLGA